MLRMNGGEVGNQQDIMSPELLRRGLLDLLEMALRNDTLQPSRQKPVVLGYDGEDGEIDMWVVEEVTHATNRGVLDVQWKANLGSVE